LRDHLLKAIDNDRDRIVSFLQDFVRARSPNPPGDTRAAMDHVRAFLDSRGLAYTLRTRDETMPNLVASRTFGDGPKHLVLNGHIDVFPVNNSAEWIVDPWSGAVVDGAIYGRGIADMKVGTTASLLTYIYLSKLADLKGRLTLTVVSDEETFGPYGARHLFDVCPEEVTGTACLNGEPSSFETVRFGEKGAFWLRFRVKAPGGHGAYPHVSPNAIELAYELIKDLKALTAFGFVEPAAVASALDASREQFDRAYGGGASDAARRITFNVGTITGGPKVNMIASLCEFEVDFRLPNGVEPPRFMEQIEAVARRHECEMEVLIENAPNWCEPNSELTQIVMRNAEALTGIKPADIVSLGNTDTRLWRYRNVPAVVFGPAPRGMGTANEHVLIEDALKVIKCHVLSAYDYLIG
jgi:succinyl-diaminopimelate desuccinylase